MVSWKWYFVAKKCSDLCIARKRYFDDQEKLFEMQQQQFIGTVKDQKNF
jgi:hypothetical protein